MPRRSRAQRDAPAPPPVAAAAPALVVTNPGRAYLIANTADATRFAAGPRSYHHAALGLAGFTRDVDASPAAAARPQRMARVTAAANAPSMVMTMRRMRQPTYDDTNVSAASHAVVVVYGPDDEDAPDADDGMPADEAMIYLGMEGGRYAARHLATAALAALRNGNIFVRCNVRVDFWFLTVPASGRQGAPLPMGRIGGVTRLAPRLLPGTRNTAGTFEQLVDLTHAAVERLKAKIDTMPNVEGSDRAFGGLLIAEVYCKRSTAASRSVGGTGGTPKARLAYKLGFQAATSSSEHPHALAMTSRLFNSRGVVANNPEMNASGTCIPRALLTAWHPVLALRSDTHPLRLLHLALEGAQARLDHCVKRREPRVTDGQVASRREEERAALEANVERVRTELATQCARMRAADELPPGVNEDGTLSDKIDGRARIYYRQIEKQLGEAFRGTHPVFNFAARVFKTPHRLDEGTVKLFRSAIKAPHRVAIQFWGPSGVDDKVGLLFPDPRATLEFVRSGGRVLNLVVAAMGPGLHASYLASPQMANNHAGGIANNRVYCGFCGGHGSRGHFGEKWRVFLHQEAGCPVGSRTSMPAALSPANLRQLDRREYAALNPGQAISCLASDATGAALELWLNRPTGWDPRSLAYESQHHLGSGVERVLRDLCSVSSADRLLEALHFAARADPEAMAALDACDLSTTPCYACRLPVGGPSVWQTQLARAGRSTSSSSAAAAGAPAASALGFQGLLRASAPQESLLLQADSDESEEEEDAPRARTEALEGLVSLGAAGAEEDDDDVPDSASAAWNTSSAAESVATTGTDASGAAGDAWEGGDLSEDVVPHKHHCHVSGALRGGARAAWAHSDCNTLMWQSTSTLVIQVANDRTMDAVVSTVFQRAFVEAHCNSRLPTLSRRDGHTRRVTIFVTASPRALSRSEIAKARAKGKAVAAWTLVSCVLRVEFRCVTSLMPGWECPAGAPAWEVARECLRKLEARAQREMERSGLWLPAFHTSVSFARADLLRTAALEAGPGLTPTSLTSQASLDSVKRIAASGRLLVGEGVETELDPPPRDKDGTPLPRTEVLLSLDIRAAYPSILKRSLPYFGHLDALVHNFEGRLEEGLAWLDAQDTGHDTRSIARLEVWGEFPAELHARMRAFPPLYGKVMCKPTDYSFFQRCHLGMDREGPAREVTAGHLFPVHGETVFARTAQIWKRLGFVFSKIGDVYATPAAPWARSYALGLEARRAAASSAGDTEALADIKLAANSVIGSLAMDASKFKRYRVVRNWLTPREEAQEDVEVSRMTTDERISDDPLFTLRAWTVGQGSCTVYEMDPRHVQHTQLVLVNRYVVSSERDDLLEMWYGGRLDGGRVPWEGFVNWGPPGSVRLCYGNTDSLYVLLRLTDVARCQGFQDVRAEFIDRFPLFDASNLLPTHPVLCAIQQRRACARGECADLLFTKLQRALQRKDVFGAVRCTTALAGVRALMVNGPNRYGLLFVDDLPDETLPEHVGQSVKLYSIPRIYNTLPDRERPTLEDFAASWLGKTLPVPPPLPDRDGHAQGTLDLTVSVPVQRHALSLWGNRHGVVQGSEPYAVLPLGSKEPLALELTEGSAW